MRPFNQLVVALIVTLATSFSINAFADSSFNVTGNGSDGTCSCNIFGNSSSGCTCFQGQNIRARCDFPSASLAAKLLKRQLQYRFINDYRCQNVKVTVRIRSNNNGTFSVTDSGHGNYFQVKNDAGNINGSISYNVSSNDPFQINVTDIQLDCKVEVPMTITVSAKDSFGNSFKRTYNSSPVVHGILH